MGTQAGNPHVCSPTQTGWLRAALLLAAAPRRVLCSSSLMCDWRFLGAALPVLASASLLAAFLLVFGGVPGPWTPSALLSWPASDTLHLRGCAVQPLREGHKPAPALLRPHLSHRLKYIPMHSKQGWLPRLTIDRIGNKALTSSSFLHIAYRRFSRELSRSRCCCAAGLR